MKVESVEAFPISVKIDEDLRGGTFSYSHYRTVVVRAVCDGAEGWGEAMTRFDPDATAVLVRYIGKGLEGRDYAGVQPAWDQAWHDLRVRGHTRGVDVEALSGIEIALQDCRGKLAGRPLNHLLSESPVAEVPVFAGSLFSSRGSLESQVEKVKASGLNGAKVKVGFGVEEDGRTLAEVRRAWPDGMLVADANGAYDGRTARRAAEAFAGLGLAWFEEPVASDDWEGYAALRGTGTRIGAGETWFPDDFRGPIEQGLVEVLEPSVSRCGGVSVEVREAERAAAHGIDLSLMVGMNSAISLAASLHVASARKTIGTEYYPFPNPLRSGLVLGVDEPSGGMIRVPGGPGLGIEVDRRFLREHSG